jgi:hypothetical protein
MFNGNHLLPIFLALGICSCTPVYHRTTTMHHLQSHLEIELKPRKNEMRLISRENRTNNIIQDTTFSYVTGTFLDIEKASDSVYLLEGGKVIYFHQSYWVSSKLPPEIKDKYINHDVKF